MPVVDSLFKVLTAGFTLWNTKEGRKYLDEVLKLKKEYYEELGKKVFDYLNQDHHEMDGRLFRSQLALDRILQQLNILADTFASGSIPIK